MIGGAIDFRVIGENWDETLRLAASIKAGTVAPSILMRRLAAYPKQNALAKTLREIGRPMGTGHRQARKLLTADPGEATLDQVLRGSWPRGLLLGSVASRKQLLVLLRTSIV